MADEKRGRFLIFLSYSGQQKHIAEDLYNKLSMILGDGKAIFFYGSDQSIRMGGSIPDSLMEAVGSCKIGVVLLSERFIESLWPMRELHQLVLRRNHCTIYPIFYDLNMRYLKAVDDILERWGDRWTSFGQEADVDGWAHSLYQVGWMRGDILRPNNTVSSVIHRIACSIVQQLHPPFYPPPAQVCKKSMQHLLNEGHSGDELRQSKGVYCEESQSSNAPLPLFSQHLAHPSPPSHAFNPYIYVPMISSSSPSFFHMPPITPQTSQGFQVPFSNNMNIQSEQTTPMGRTRHGNITCIARGRKYNKVKGTKGESNSLSKVDGGITKSIAKMTKRKGKQALNIDANEDEDNKTSCVYWKDPWVVSLIHERGSLQEEFNKLQKQGIDLWSKIANRLGSTHCDFSLSSERCQKKWSHIYDLYKADQLHNSIFGNDFQYTCKWYGIVDEYMHNQEHVRVYSHALSTDDVYQQEETPSTQISRNEAKKSKNKQVHRGQKDAQINQLIAQVIENGKDIIAHLQKIATRKEASKAKRDAVDAERLEILHTLSAAFVRLVDQACQK